MSCERCKQLLSDGLDLCVRARKLDAQDRANVAVDISSDAEEWEASGKFSRHAERHNIQFPDQPMFTKSATIPLWVQDQYEKDLARWEEKTRHHLAQGCRE